MMVEEEGEWVGEGWWSTMKKTRLRHSAGAWGLSMCCSDAILSGRRVSPGGLRRNCD